SSYAPYRGGARPPQYADPAYPFHDLGIHGLSVIEAFLGEIRNLDVRCSSTHRNPPLALDEWHALVMCERGVGRAYLSWNARPMQNEWIVHGTRGVIHVDCYLQTVTVRRQRRAPKMLGRAYEALANSVSTIGGVAVNGLRMATGRLQPSPGIHESVRA